jgi:hypothetical protein
MATATLQSRDEFRQLALERDHGFCVLCHKPAVDVHHIIDRKLWEDGGYYNGNAASLCSDCHLQAEQTVISCESLWSAIGDKILPPNLDSHEQIDHWGNPILPNNLRMRGELFDEECVQKALAAGGMLNTFTKYVKYPRTWHVPWSPGNAKGDKKHKSLEQFVGKRVVVSSKMDGENTTMYDDYIHARSVDSRNHESRNWVRRLHAQVGWQLPSDFRLCGENLFAKHSIHYHHLTSWFLVFNIWNENNTAISWDETVEYAGLLDLQTVEVLYDGIWDEEIIKSLWTPERNQDAMEGYVIRLAGPIRYRDWTMSTAKYVRHDHVQTDEHWMESAVVKNGIET